MLNQVVNDPRAWRADTVDERRSWTVPLSPRSCDALDQAIQDLRRDRRPTTALRLTAASWNVCQEELQRARTALERGRGFVIVNGVPPGRYSPQEMQAVYWLVGR